MSHRIFGVLAAVALLVACGSSKAGSSSSGTTTGGSSGSSSAATTTGGSSGTSSVATTTGGTSGKSSTTLGSGSSSGASTTSAAGGSSSGAPVLTALPSTATLLTGDALTFNTLNGVGTVTWQATLGTFSGAIYTAPSAAGTDTVTATDSSGAKANATVTIVSGAPIYSGSVSYAGSKTGWIFISSPNQGSAAIPAPGSFEIRGLAPCGSASCTSVSSISAFMDVLGTGSYDAAVDPAATMGVNWPSAGASAVALLLQDPTPAAPDQAPTYVEVYPSSGGAFVTWAPLTSGTSALGAAAEVADSYKVYASAAADLSNPVATQVVQATVFHGTSLTGLTNGSSLYFGVSALLAGQEGPLSMPVGPITIGTTPGGHAITGTLDATGLVPFGPAYVLAYTASPSGGYTGATYFTQVVPLTASQGYSIEGVPDGTYTVAAFLDQNVSGTLAPGDPSTLGQLPAASSLVTLSGADVAGPTLTLTDAPAVGTAVTSYSAQDSFQALTLYVQANGAFPVQATLSSGPHATTLPVDMGLYAGQGAPTYQFTLAGINSAYGDRYTFNVLYADGTNRNLIAQVTGVYGASALATLVSPAAGSVVSNPPTFSWTAPAAPPSSYAYQLYLLGDFSETFWEVVLPSTSTQATYPSSRPSLSAGPPYSWEMEVLDTNGNSATSASAAFGL